MSSDRYLQISWEEFHRDCKTLAQHLAGLRPWQGLVAITRGGLIPAGILAHELNIRLIDTLGASSYGDDEKQGALEIIKTASDAMAGEGFIIVDDLVDTGATAHLARRLLPQGHLAAVYAKPAGLGSIDSHVRQVAQETWIVFPWEI
ncbi:MAG: xanthine phosphoribosyltransferase [Holosporales bacterium]